jgi:hypothetical protein
LLRVTSSFSIKAIKALRAFIGLDSSLPTHYQ